MLEVVPVMIGQRLVPGVSFDAKLEIVVPNLIRQAPPNNPCRDVTVILFSFDELAQNFSISIATHLDDIGDGIEKASIILWKMWIDLGVDNT